MKLKNILKTTALMAAAVTVLASCIKSNGDSYAGFGGVRLSATAYANNTRGYMQFLSYGDWHMQVRSGSDWLRPDTLQGKGMFIYTIPVYFTPNTTGKVRSAQIYIEDINNTSANVTFPMGQWATRSDGSMGGAPLVKGIKGSDGSEISLSYDSNARPIELIINKGGQQLRRLDYVWGDTLLTVRRPDRKNLVGTITNGFLPVLLKSETLTAGQTSTDSVGYFSNDMLAGAASTALNFEERLDNRSEYISQAVRYDNQKITNPDSIAHIDTLSYTHKYADGNVVKVAMKLSYDGRIDNRNQSVDANQLLLGVSECNPYLLTGLFRSVRSSLLISKAATAAGNYTMEATLNADKSFNTVTVTDPKGGKVVYTFKY